MSIATFVMAAASGLQAVAYLGRFGTNAHTDGFFVAFAVYTTFGVFSQTLRVTCVPLLVAPRARLSVREFAGALALLAVPVLVATVALAGPLAHLLAPGLRPGGRSVTESALPVLGIAMALQLWAAGGATVLAVRDRFGSIATAYIAGAVAGLATFAGVVGTAGVQTLGWSMLAMAVVTCATMLADVARSGGLDRAGRASRPRDLVRAIGPVVSGTPAYLALNMLFVVTLAFASKGATGDSTVLSYAFLFASYLVAGTSTALGMSRIPEMTRRARATDCNLVEETVPQGYRFAIMLVAPAMALLITAGAPLIHVVVPHSLTTADVHRLRTFTALLLPWTVIALLANFLIPALLAAGRSRLLNWLAVPLIVLHVAATALGSALFGVDGAIGAIVIAPMAVTIIMLVAGAGDRSAAVASRLARQTGVFVGLAAVAFGLAWAVTAPLQSVGLSAICAAGLGGVAYLAGLGLVARRELGLLRGAFARRGSTAA